MKKYTLILVSIISQIFLSCLNKEQEYEIFGIYLTKNDELVLPLAEVEQYHRRELTAKLSKFLAWE